MRAQLAGTRLLHLAIHAPELQVAAHANHPSAGVTLVVIRSSLPTVAFAVQLWCSVQPAPVYSSRRYWHWPPAPNPVTLGIQGSPHSHSFCRFL